MHFLKAQAHAQAMAKQTQDKKDPKKKAKNFDPNEYGSLSDEDLLAASEAFVAEEQSTFGSVARHELVGIDHHVEVVDMIAERLRNYSLKGVEMDCGAAFWGQPGTGKTLSARYLASTSEAIFVNVSAFPRRESAMTSQDIRRLYRVSRAVVKDSGRPVLLFWDEFDGFAKLAEGASSEQKEAVATLKEEMSGIAGKATGVFLVIAMNSYPGSMDSALFRSGRIGKVLRFDRPNRIGRRELLRYYYNKVSGGRVTDNDEWYDTLSYLLGKSTMPSDIEEHANEVWTNVCLRARDEGIKYPYMRMSDPTGPLLRRYAGDPTNVVRSEGARRHIATRLAAAALVARTQGVPVQLIACFVRGYEKVDMLVESDEAEVETLQGQKDEIAVAFAGALAERMLGFEQSLVSSQSKAGATALAQVFVERYGGNEMRIAMGALSESRVRQDISPHLPQSVYERSTKAIEALLKEQEGVAKKILNAYGKEHIEALASRLLAREYLLQHEIDDFVDPKNRQEQVANVVVDGDDVDLPGQYL